MQFWGDIHTEESDNSSIKRVLKNIKRNEKLMSAQNVEARKQEIEKGFSKLLGYLLTWRKINRTT